VFYYAVCNNCPDGDIMGFALFSFSMFIIAFGIEAFLLVLWKLKGDSGIFKVIFRLWSVVFGVVIYIYGIDIWVIAGSTNINNS